MRGERSDLAHILCVELIKKGNFDENIMGDEMKALVSTPE